MSVRWSLLALCMSAPLAFPQSPTIGTCPVFPADNVWNAKVDTLPLDANSARYVTTIGTTKSAHADFGSGLWNGGPIGIPFIQVPGAQPKVKVTFDYADESDPGPYPIPSNAPVEGGNSSTGDRHVLVLDRDNCILYETYDSHLQSDGSWHAGSGAVFQLKTDTLRPAGWTSADAAGLPIFPGLVRYDEAMSGQINHALRFTAPQTRKAYIWPARHYASSLTGTDYPPMGQRFRLRQSFDVSGFAPEVQTILRALKTYGMILADNGSSWYISGAPDDRWKNTNLAQLSRLKGSDFESVDESSLIVNPNSGQAVSGSTPPVVTAALSAVVLSANSVVGGSNLTGNHASITAAAPAGGVSVQLSSSNPAVAAVPATAVVAAGATSATFRITTQSVSVATNVTISASYLGVTKSAVLTVEPKRPRR